MEFKPLSDSEKTEIMEIMPFDNNYYNYLNVDIIFKDFEDVLKEICAKKDVVEFLKQRQHYDNYYIDANNQDYSEEFEEYSDEEKQECIFLSYFMKLREIITLNICVEEDFSDFDIDIEEQLFDLVKNYLNSNHSTSQN